MYMLTCVAARDRYENVEEIKFDRDKRKETSSQSFDFKVKLIDGKAQVGARLDDAYAYVHVQMFRLDGWRFLRVVEECWSILVCELQEGQRF
jgi:hypothetical protein